MNWYIAEKRWLNILVSLEEKDAVEVSERIRSPQVPAKTAQHSYPLEKKCLTLALFRFFIHAAQPLALLSLPYPIKIRCILK